MKLVMVVAFGVVVGCTGRDQESSVESALTSCVDLPAVADAELRNPPGSQNFGSLPTLQVSNKVESVVRFDLSSLPTLSAIDSASLNVYVNGTAGSTINTHRVTTAWDEATVSYATFAQHFDPQIAASFSLVAGQRGPRSVDLQ
ncbi:MAG TPA: DNRLRE domain-containing protein, partial [Kofleriaceae bacterium]|nr:DNRLRE domain-containing protein [Kofleriaceae bacterium]